MALRSETRLGPYEIVAARRTVAPIMGYWLIRMNLAPRKGEPKVK